MNLKNQIHTSASSNEEALNKKKEESPIGNSSQKLNT